VGGDARDGGKKEFGGVLLIGQRKMNGIILEEL